MPKMCYHKYNKKEIDNSGEKIKINSEDDNTYDIIDYWRSLHIGPLNVVKSNLYIYSKKIAIKNTEHIKIIASRLKRIESIKNKLQRQDTNSMRLTQMQDIGGCRMILSSIEELNEIKRLFEKFKNKKEIKKIEDYIQNPKRDGYRGIHIIYIFILYKLDDK